MYLSYKARIYPNKMQLSLINETFGASRFVWNYLLDRANKRYLRRGEYTSRFDMCSMLPEMKKWYPWLSHVDSTALTATVDFLSESRQAFFRKQAGKPKFKSKKNPVRSFTSKSASISYKDRHVKLPKLGWFLMHNKRLPEDGGKIKRATLSVNAIGEYYISFLVEEDVQPLPKVDKAIGIDMGVDSFLTDSDGNTIDNPKFYSEAKAKLAEEQRALSRKQKGSNNYLKQKRKVSKCQLKVARQREHFHNCLVKRLIENNQIICVENLGVKQMLSVKKRKTLTRKVKRNCNRSITDVGWSEFLTKLTHKAEMNGRTVVAVSRHYPSSQTCHCCGLINPLVKDLKIRTWTCPGCSKTHDRDRNAAINILHEGLRQLAG